MRKLQNTISTLGNLVVRQGNQLIVRAEALRSLCASSISALHQYASYLAKQLGDDAWQGPSLTWFAEPRIGTAPCFGQVATVVAVTVKQDQRRHHMIMCRPAAA